MALDLNEIALEAHPRTPRTKARLDSEVFDLAYERRLSMATPARGGPASAFLGAEPEQP